MKLNDFNYSTSFVVFEVQIIKQYFSLQRPTL